MKKIGVIPARMAASRFPGKPLHLILGKPMLEHVYLRAKMYDKWDSLFIATCDSEIEKFANEKGIPVIMTGDHHTRALDRVAESIELLDEPVSDDDASRKAILELLKEAPLYNIPIVSSFPK